MPESSILEALNKARSKQNQNKEHAKKAVVLTDTAKDALSLSFDLNGEMMGRWSLCSRIRRFHEERREGTQLCGGG